MVLDILMFIIHRYNQPCYKQYLYTTYIYTPYISIHYIYLYTPISIHTHDKLLKMIIFKYQNNQCHILLKNMLMNYSL